MRSYKQQLIIDADKLYQKLQEKFSCDEEVKNIISELKIKIKDLEYMNKKQWQILKKFNLQEKIYREEVRLLNESDKMKRNDIYKEAIEKLTAAHIGGFEPPFVLKNKIILKVQNKFDISEVVINELRKLNYNSEVNHKKNQKLDFTNPVEISEDNLLTKRYEDQIIVLEKFIKENFLNPKIRDRDREYECVHNFMHNKQELKRYEKEIELKAGKLAYLNDEEGSGSLSALGLVSGLGYNTFQQSQYDSKYNNKSEKSSHNYDIQHKDYNASNYGNYSSTNRNSDYNNNQGYGNSYNQNYNYNYSYNQGTQNQSLNFDFKYF